MAESQFKPATDKHEVIRDVCYAIDEGDLDKAKRILSERYPFVPLKHYYSGAKPVKEVAPTNTSEKRTRRSISEAEKLEVYIRDGFTDRYSRQKLVHPQVLEIISYYLPKDFPATYHAPLDRTHIAYYDLWPSLEHIEPFSRGGSETMDNFVTTSWVNNLIKGDYSLDEIGERLLPAGDMAEWDGLYGWFQNHTAKNPDLMQKVKDYFRSQL